MNGTHTITANALPTAPTIAKPADVCYNGDALVFTATGYSGALTWTAVTSDGSKNGDIVTYAKGAATGTKTVTARSSQTFTGAPACESAPVTQSAAVNVLPANPTGVGNSRIGEGAVTISASSPDAVIDWYAAATGGSSVSTGESYTPTITESTTYYAEARNSTTGCVSAPRTAVLAEMSTIPANPIGIDGSCCPNGTLNFSASSPGAEIDWYAAATGGSKVSTGASYTRTNMYASLTYYAEARHESSGLVSVARTPVVGTVVANPTYNTTCSPPNANVTATTAQSGVTVYWSTGTVGTSSRNVSISATVSAYSTGHGRTCPATTFTPQALLSPVGTPPSDCGCSTSCQQQGICLPCSTTITKMNISLCDVVSGNIYGVLSPSPTTTLDWTGCYYGTNNCQNYCPGSLGLAIIRQCLNPSCSSLQAISLRCDTAAPMYVYTK
jgi:hypothetical protein